MNNSLAELSQSIFSTLGLSGVSNFFSLSENPASRECLVLVDGLGKNAIDEYAKIEAQNYVDNDTKQKLAEYGCPPPDPNIEDFTPVTPDICS